MRLRLGLTAVLLLTGCTTSSAPAAPAAPTGPRLTAFGSCAELTTALRTAAKAAVNPNGLQFPTIMIARPPLFSSADADQPNVVKTDGRRIVSLAPGGTLRVIDAVAKRVTGSIAVGTGEADLLISGDRALVLNQGPFPYSNPPIKSGEKPPPRRYTSTELVLVDISGAPRVLTRLHSSGSLLDARQTGDVARIVLSHPAFISSSPRIGAKDEERLAEYRKAIDAAGADAWLPQWTTLTETGNQVVVNKGKVPCESVLHPPAFSGRSVVTALTVPLSAPKLDTVAPVAVATESDTAYSTPTGLYLPAVARGPKAEIATTDIYRFDTAGADQPVFRAGATLPGVAGRMSEWDGHLRVLTGDRRQTDQVALRVLTAGDLRPVGALDELGRRIGFRFDGPRAYSTGTPARLLDLSDPAAPRLAGSLTVGGAPVVLREIGPDRLVAIDRNTVILYDVSDPGAPRELARQPVQGTTIDDSRGVLWHPPAQLLVVPATERTVALRIPGDTMTVAGEIHPPAFTDRTLVVGDELWNPYAGGWQVSRLSTLEPVTTVRY